MQTITLTSIMQTWAGLLANNTTIQDFCQAKYGKDPIVYLGFNVKQPPAEQDCPCIVIFPGCKKEGLEESRYSYRVSIGWYIYNTNLDTSTPGIVKYTGLEESDALGQLIWETVAEASPGNPVARVLYDLMPMEFFPQIFGCMELKINVTAPIGGTINY